MPSPTKLEGDVTSIHLTPTELSTKQLSSHNLQWAVEALHCDGLVVLENAISPDHLDKLNARMMPEAKYLYAQKNTHHNFGTGTGNIQQEPPQEAEYIFLDVIANPFATEIISCMLGPKPQLRFLSANTAFKVGNDEGRRQPAHVDVEFDFPKGIPFGFCVNVTLVDADERNGATEVWPGSHLSSVTPDLGIVDPVTDGVRADLLEKRRAERPPVQLGLKKGALVIRDFRLWHAGMPNHTDEPRVMLVMVLFPKWYRSTLEMVLPESIKGKIDWGDVEPCVKWVKDGEDYLKGAHDHDFALLP